MMEISGNMRKVEFLPNRNCEAGYAPDWNIANMKRVKFFFIV